MTIRLYDDIASLDPALNASSPGYQVSMFLYDRVVSIKNGKVEPYLAESWSVSPNSVEFKIRKGVACSDGSSLTPSAIAASMTRVMNPATKAATAQGYFPEGVSFTSDDAAGTFTATTKKPNPTILLTFTHPVFSVVCPAGVKDPKEIGSESFGSGPYVLDKSVPGTSYTFKKRSGYRWGPKSNTGNLSSLPTVVTAKVLQNESTAANVFLQGGLDITSSLSESAVKRMRKTKSNETSSPDAFAFLLFNQAAGPGADPTIRRAIAQAVDPKAYAAAAQGELATPSANLMPDATVCAQTDGAKYRPKFNLSEARKTLENAGWKRNSGGTYEKDGEPLTVRVNSHNQEGSAGDYLSQTLKDLGAKVKTQQVELAGYVDDLLKGDWDLYAATINLLDSPATLSVSLSREGLDVAHIRNNPYEKDMAAANSAPEFEQSCELWKSAQDELVKNVDVVPEAHLNLIYFDKAVDFSPGFFGLIEPTSLARK